jgi:hypothetical protein
MVTVPKDNSEALLNVNLSGRGDTVSLWEDNLQHQPFSIKYPNLYTYVNNKNLSLKAGLAAPNLLDILRLPMSRAAYNEFLVFREDLDSLRADSDQDDVWVYQWSGGLYSSRHSIDISLRPSHHLLHFVGFGKQSVCRK